MKRSLKYNLLVVPNKIKVDEKIILDDQMPAEYTSLSNDVVSLSLFPLITIAITRPFEFDENGTKKRPPWNPNDSLPMTKYSLPIFVRELKELCSDLRIKELYNYTNKRLELNEDLAEKITKTFKIGNNGVQLKPVVIALPDDTRVEGAKLKINNEDSVVLLTVNELDSLLFTLCRSNYDQVALMLFSQYCRDGVKGKINDWNNSRN